MSEPSGTHPGGRADRLRELLDVVLAESATNLSGMADQAHASPYHFAHQVRRGAHELPVALRRRVHLERAAWRLRGGASVTETAWEAGYESVEGFARAYRRAFGYPPSETPADRPSSTVHWLPAPNGIHFHAPNSLWIAAEPRKDGGGEQVTALLAHHDIADIRILLHRARQLDPQDWPRVRLPGLVLLQWAGPEESIAVLMERAVAQLEVWLAAIEGWQRPASVPEPISDGRPCPSPDQLLQRLDLVGPRWLSMVADVERRGAWGDRLIDALCDPPESFVLGSILAHVLTYNAQRRGITRALLRQDGASPADDDGDPIMWLRGETG